MPVVIAYLAGVATGWVMRSAFGSLRGLSVSAMQAGYEVAERARRFVAVEKEFVEDLVAEAKARYEAAENARQRSERAERPAPKAVA
jgi:hypothetical protein